MKKYLVLDKLEYKDKIFIFKDFYFLQVYKDVIGFYIEDKNLELFCQARTLKELKDKISEDLYVAWKLYVECDENELSQDAKNLRKILIQKINKI